MLATSAEVPEVQTRELSTGRTHEPAVEECVQQFGRHDDKGVVVT
jgi:hypothetical protein